MRRSISRTKLVLKKHCEHQVSIISVTTYAELQKFTVFCCSDRTKTVFSLFSNIYDILYFGSQMVDIR